MQKFPFNKVLEKFGTIDFLINNAGIIKDSMLKNMTEDIEITWHLQYKGYKIKMAVPSRVYSIAPDKIKDWIKQRNRWNIGGLQTISKYKSTFLRKGTLGKFILPFFLLSWVVGLFGIGILGYRIFRTIALKYLSASYSIQAQTAVFSLSDVNLTLSALIFFGLMVFFLSLFYTIFALSNIKEDKYKKENWVIPANNCRSSVWAALLL